MHKLSAIGFLLCTLLIANTLAQSIQEPPVFLNAKLLKANKEQIQKGNHTLVTAQKSLLAKADQTLTKETYSVTSKSKTPPSGDKHDYMSVGPYWWPDSTKANGLPYIRKDGQVNPERFSIKDSDYISALCNDVELLAVAYYFSDDEKYARRAAELLRVWFLNSETKMNPNLNYGQAIPGITDGRGIGLIDTRALAKLVNAVQLLKGSKAWPQTDHVALQGWFRQFLAWMQTSPVGKDEEDEHNNHGTYYDVQAVAFALFLGDTALAKQILEQKTTKRIQSQLNEDGSQPHELARTVSWGYSVMNLKGFFILAQLAENVQTDLWRYVTPDGKSIEKAFLWMVPYAEGKKTWEHKQIKALHTDDFSPLETVAISKYKPTDLPALTQYKHSDNSLFVLTNTLF
ncbi:alginate lyase family protein [Spirosoma validum]|uniref:Alginate lyase family protein n=1 Tax=Spirosoma validum TaxID=2771355 RepID=A0A927B7G4_9BACT|nr:alginate lyase family protein [Spirosoma validum]MBD2756779.1 alginate lyase family protein [Spirosoma validum]